MKVTTGQIPQIDEGLLGLDEGLSPPVALVIYIITIVNTFADTTSLHPPEVQSSFSPDNLV